jgi:hypothetical protein
LARLVTMPERIEARPKGVQQVQTPASGMSASLCHLEDWS